MIKMKKVSFCVFLLLIFIALVITSCRGPSPLPESTLAPTVKPTAPVYLMPSSADAAPGEEFEVMVYVQLENRGISSGEIILTFNGGTMEVVNVEPGALLGANPLAGLKKIDNQAGTAKYALAKTGSASIPTPPGIFAIFKLKILESAKSGAYELKLSKVSLADENFKDITGIKAQGTTVKVS